MLESNNDITKNTSKHNHFADEDEEEEEEVPYYT